MDRTGKTVIRPQFDEERDFFRGLAAVLIGEKWGFIDEKGKVKIAPRFDDVLDFLDDLAPVQIGRKWGYIDAAGRMAIEPRFQAAGEFHEGLALVYIWDRTACNGRIYSRDDAPISAFRFPGDPMFMSCFAQDGRFGFIDKTGEFIISPRFFMAQDFSEGLAVFREEGREGKYGYIDRTGAVAINPRFNQAFSFSEGLARVEVSAHTAVQISRDGGTGVQEIGAFSGLRLRFVG